MIDDAAFFMISKFLYFDIEFYYFMGNEGAVFIDVF